MKFSNDNITWSVPEAYVTTKTWTMSSTQGTKYVYIKFKDAAGNWSTVYSHGITVDTAVPTGSININGGATATNTTAVTLNLAAIDTG